MCGHNVLHGRNDPRERHVRHARSVLESLLVTGLHVLLVQLHAGKLQSESPSACHNGDDGVRREGGGDAEECFVTGAAAYSLSLSVCVGVSRSS